MAENSEMSRLVQRNDWQKIRENMKGTWMQNPVNNVRILRRWIGNIQTTEYEKLKIVMNYLTGTGFRTGKIKHPEIQKLRDDISAELKRRKLLEKNNTYKKQ